MGTFRGVIVGRADGGWKSKDGAFVVVFMVCGARVKATVGVITLVVVGVVVGDTVGAPLPVLSTTPPEEVVPRVVSLPSSPPPRTIKAATTMATDKSVAATTNPKKTGFFQTASCRSRRLLPMASG